MEKYGDIRNISEEAYNFLQEGTLLFLQEGKYELENGVGINIESYVTQERRDRCFENHNQYIDVQIVLQGEEIIEVCSLEDMVQSTPYNAEKDITFYHNNKIGTQYLLKKGEYLIVYPGQAHMPCVRSKEESTFVRKAVFKIPICKLKNLIFMDIDGTLTDGKIYIGNVGESMKAFSIKDGYAITHLLPKNDIIPVIITGRKSEIVRKRCEEIGIKNVFQNVLDKRQKMIEFANSHGLYINEIGIIPHTYYMGDDIPDLECMLIAEKKGCPADAVNEIKAVSDFVSTKRGGDGAVREFVEWICNKDWQIK